MALESALIISPKLKNIFQQQLIEEKTFSMEESKNVIYKIGATCDIQHPLPNDATESRAGVPNWRPAGQIWPAT